MCLSVCVCVSVTISFFFSMYALLNFNFIVVFYNTKIKKFIFILTPVSFRLFSFFFKIWQFFFSKQNQYFFSFIHSFSRENKKMNVHHLIIIFFCSKQFNYHHIDTSSCLDTRQYCITMVVE